jgi:hypothetical protein
MANGIPSNDTFERVFDRLKLQAFQACFQDWVQAISTALRIKHIAIDGKTLRGSGSAQVGPLHLVSAWASAQHLSPGQVAVEAKSHEITAIPALLGLLELKGAPVTIDAMRCQKAIARKIVDQDGHYALSVKDSLILLAEVLRAWPTACSLQLSGAAGGPFRSRATQQDPGQACQSRKGLMTSCRYHTTSRPAAVARFGPPDRVEFVWRCSARRTHRPASAGVGSCHIVVTASQAADELQLGGNLGAVLVHPTPMRPPRHSSLSPA